MTNSITDYNPEVLLDMYLQMNDTSQLYAYTLQEGDHWNIIELKYINEIEILEQVKRFNSCIYWKNLSDLDVKLKFSSLMFPDGRIWDSKLKGFRPYSG